ncbi:MAG: DUF2079 domain-containing protein [Marmoricola sp.]
MATALLQRSTQIVRVRPSAAWVPWMVGIAIAAIHAFIACLRYANFDVSSWDLTIFTQAIDNYAHFRPPVASVHGVGFNVLGDHFSPILVLLAPLFWISQNGVMLLLAEAVAFGWSAVPITRLARERLGARPGLILGLAYGLSAGLLEATVVDFHEIAFAVPLLAYSLVALAEERWRAAAWFAVPLLLVKEDLGFTVAAIGLLIAARGARRIGLLLAGAGLAGTLLAVFALIPILAPGHRYAYFSQYDSGHAHNSMSSVWSALDPSRWTTGLSTKLRTLLTFGSTTVFTGWGSTIALLAVPTLGWRFISAQSSYWGTSWHYDAVLMPIGFVAAIETCERLSKRDDIFRQVARAVPVLALVVSLTFTSAAPLYRLFDGSRWRTSPTQRAEESALHTIPRGAVVLSDLGLMSHLAARNPVYWIGDMGKVLPDYIATVDGAGWTPPTPEHAVTFWDRQYSGHRFRLISAADGVTVLQRIR